MEQVIAVDEAVIEDVVRTFYNKVRKDPMLGPIFDEHIKDWEPHLQKMFAFWSAVILHTRRYDGRPMPKHVVLPVDARHFDRWLQLFAETTEEICPGADAALFQKKAQYIAQSLELGIAHYNGALLRIGERFMRPAEELR